MSATEAVAMGSRPARKFLEGWVSHLDAAKKEWVRYWLVLRGNVLHLFMDDHTISENLAGTLLIRPGIAIHCLPSKKRFKFLLVTASSSGHLQENVFRFDNENEFDLWKSFLLGISQGKVPEGVNLSGDQLQALKMAVQDVPLSADTSSFSDFGSSVSEDSACNSLRSIIRKPAESGDEEDALSRGIADLERRRIEVSRRAMTAAVSDMKVGVGGGSLSRLTSDSGDSDAFSMHSSVSSRNSSFEFGTGSTSSASFSHKLPMSVKRIPFSATSHFDLDNNNKELRHHKFYTDVEKNKEVPSWFVNCSRDDAVQALMADHHYGNVLMRPSAKSGKYVITLCRKNSGKSEISHYSVVRTTSGYKINVRNEHVPLSCLSDVMALFVSVAGTSTKPLTTNDLHLLTQMASDATDTSFNSSRTCTNSSNDASHVIETVEINDTRSSPRLITGTGTLGSSTSFASSGSHASTYSHPNDLDYANCESFPSQCMTSEMSTPVCQSTTGLSGLPGFQPGDDDYQNLSSSNTEVSNDTSSSSLPPLPPPANSKPPLSPSTSNIPPPPPPASSKPTLSICNGSMPPTPPPASSKPPRSPTTSNIPPSPPPASSKPTLSIVNGSMPPTPPPASSKPTFLFTASNIPPTPPPASSKPTILRTTSNIPPTPPPASSKPTLMSTNGKIPPPPPPASSKPRMSVRHSSGEFNSWCVEDALMNGNESLGSKRMAPPTAPRKRLSIPVSMSSDDLCSQMRRMNTVGNAQS